MKNLGRTRRWAGRANAVERAAAALFKRSKKGTTSMGQWNISIHGTGAHHNKANKTDANRMAADFVRQLKKAGHTVTGATITYGGEEDVKNVDPDEEAKRWGDAG